MAQQLIPNDVFVQGNLSAKTVTLPASTVTDANVVGATGIQASKLQHQYETPYSQASGASVVTATVPLHTVFGATATILGFYAGTIVVATGNDTVTVDLRKNGSTILTAVITLDSTKAARTLYTPAGFTSTSLVAADWLDVVVTATHNTGVLPQGLYVRLVHREDPN